MTKFKSKEFGQVDTKTANRDFLSEMGRRGAAARKRNADAAKLAEDQHLITHCFRCLEPRFYVPFSGDQAVLVCELGCEPIDQAIVIEIDEAIHLGIPRGLL